MGSKCSSGFIGEIWQYRDKLSLLHHDFQVLTVKCAACLRFCDTLLHNSSTPNDIIEMSLMPSGPPSFVCGAQTLAQVVFFHTRGSKEAWELVHGLKRSLGTSSGTPRGLEVLFQPTSSSWASHFRSWHDLM